MLLYETWAASAYNKVQYYIEKHLKEQECSLPPEQVAGIIYVENSSINPKSSRFEESIWKSIKLVKQGGVSTALPGLNSGPIHEYIKETESVDCLRALATSYGTGQIMGYHYYMKWGLEPPEFMNLSLDDSIQYQIKFINSGLKYAKTYEQLLRWWNTGSINGKTYDPKYVEKAVGMSLSYKKIMEKNRGK